MQMCPKLWRVLAEELTSISLSEQKKATYRSFLPAYSQVAQWKLCLTEAGSKGQEEETREVTEDKTQAR